MTDTIIVAIVAVALTGLLVGFIIGRYTGAGPKSPRSKETLEEFTQYKLQVNDHFQKTADLTQKLADDYRDLYGHLSGAAVELCEDLEVSTLEHGGLGAALPQVVEKKDNESQDESQLADGAEGEQRENVSEVVSNAATPDLEEPVASAEQTVSDLSPPDVAAPKRSANKA